MNPRILAAVVALAIGALVASSAIRAWRVDFRNQPIRIDAVAHTR